MQSVVFGVVFQLTFQVFMIGYFTGFVPHFVGVVVGDAVRLRLTGSQTESENVPEFAGTPPMSVKRLYDL
jgi:hypothetical protein